MSEETKIVPFNEIPDSGVDLNLAVAQAQKMTEIIGTPTILSKPWHDWLWLP